VDFFGEGEEILGDLLIGGDGWGSVTVVGFHHGKSEGEE
jgi:hypothetical protein